MITDENIPEHPYVSQSSWKHQPLSKYSPSICSMSPWKQINEIIATTRTFIVDVVVGSWLTLRLMNSLWEKAASIAYPCTNYNARHVILLVRNHLHHVVSPYLCSGFEINRRFRSRRRLAIKIVNFSQRNPNFTAHAR